MKFDDILREVGEFGPYQRLVFILTMLTNIEGGVFLLHTVFILGEPKHRCAIPGYDNDTYDIQSGRQSLLINQSIPLIDGQYTHDECHVVTGNVSYDINNRPINGTLTKCSSWVYDTAVFELTFLSEEDLVCDKSIYTPNAQMIFYGGMLVGALVSGVASDRFGRKPTMYTCMLLLMGSSVGLAFAPSYVIFVILNSIIGGSMMGFFMTSYVIGLEIVGPSKRVWAGVLGNFLFVLGYLIVGGVAYFVRNWRHLQLAVSANIVLFISYWWLVPESPRWLLSQGRVQEAYMILRRIAASNCTELPESLLEHVKPEPEENQSHIWHLFTNRTLCIWTIILFFDWFSCSLAYFGLSLHVGSLNGNFYLDFVLYSLVELPAYTMSLLLLDRVGRRLLFCVPFLVGGVACLATIFTTLYEGQNLYPVTMTLAMTGKFGVTVAFAVVYMYSAELFPTVHRNAGLGGASLISRGGGMVAPYLVNIGRWIGGDFGQAFPLVAVGAFSVSSALLTLCLPETLNRNLPETMKDAEKLKR